jgi:hypothetical protein
MFALRLIHPKADTESEPTDFDEFQASLDGFDLQPLIDFDAEMADADRQPDLLAMVDRFAGEFFHHTWRRRLADSQGDFGHVARQMRKAGIPLELTLMILLTPERPRVCEVRALPTPAPAPRMPAPAPRTPPKSNQAKLERAFDEVEFATA